MKPLTRRELDSMGCQDPSCTGGHGPMFFHGQCHPRAACVVTYDGGVVRMSCSVCGLPIASVAVASGAPQPFRKEKQ